MGGEGERWEGRRGIEWRVWERRAVAYMMLARSWELHCCSLLQLLLPLLLLLLPLLLLPMRLLLLLLL